MYINSSKSGCIAAGRVGFVEFRTVGSKDTPLLKFSLTVGKDGDKPLRFNCQAWNPIATRFRDAFQKGDQVLVAGVWQINEHNGETYYNLNLDFIQVMDDPRQSRGDTLPSVEVNGEESLF